MGRTKEDIAETLQPYQVGKPVTCGIIKLSKAKGKVLAQSVLSSKEAKEAGYSAALREKERDIIISMARL